MTGNINCEIESKSDFLTGMYLVTRIADSELDENALLTIQEDCPEFILPFNYKSVNGQTEFTYKVGSLCKLHYFYGDISHTEYIALWRGLLRPLLECRNWFMNPASFVLSTDYLYFDKKKDTVAYVYIPSVNGCSGHGAFNEMAVEVSKNIKVADPVLENKVLRSIVNDFKPEDFLKMLTEHAETAVQRSVEPPVWEVRGQAAGENISEIIPALQADEESGKDTGAFRIFSGRGKKGSKTKRNGFKNMVPAGVPAAVKPGVDNTAAATQETRQIISGTGLRCVGRPQFPQAIEVGIADGGVFTIGRYDVSAGKKRSSFEFEAKTKAVSRRHAAIERTGTAYNIVDLSSSAGTFVNDKKLPPNTPFEIKPGYRVSFGNLGADYVWEVS